MQNTKKCFKCNIDKSLSEFYKHPQMLDGYLNKCKTCTRKDVQERVNKLSIDPEWIELERARHREKYHRLNYKEKHKPSPEMKKEAMERYKISYPEKQKAKNKSQRISCTKGNNLHHWSYNEEHWKDVIEMSVADHNLLHRHIDYDQSTFMYRNKNGVLLDTRDSHITLLKNLK